MSFQKKFYYIKLPSGQNQERQPRIEDRTSQIVSINTILSHRRLRQFEMKFINTSFAVEQVGIIYSYSLTLVLTAMIPYLVLVIGSFRNTSYEQPTESTGYRSCGYFKEQLSKQLLLITTSIVIL